MKFLFSNSRIPLKTWTVTFHRIIKESSKTVVLMAPTVYAIRHVIVCISGNVFVSGVSITLRARPRDYSINVMKFRFAVVTRSIDC